MVEDALEKFKSIPSIFKWIKGLEEASRFSEVPFNLVEAKFQQELDLETTILMKDSTMTEQEL